MMQQRTMSSGRCYCVDMTIHILASISERKSLLMIEREIVDACVKKAFDI